MKFLKIDNVKIKKLFDDIIKQDLLVLLEYIEELFKEDDTIPTPLIISNKNLGQRTTKRAIETLLMPLIQNSSFREKVYKKLTRTKVSQALYKSLIWSNVHIESQDLIDKYNYPLADVESSNYNSTEMTLEDELLFITRKYQSGYRAFDILFIKNSYRAILQLFHPIPDDYELLAYKEPIATEFVYTNEKGIFEFLPVALGLIKTQLISFGKSNEKPLVKSLNMLHSSVNIEEFYQDKGLDRVATDMLTRTLYYYYKANGKLGTNNLNILKDAIEQQFKDSLPFHITRIFASHLKKVRFANYLLSQSQLFDIVKIVINSMPKDEFVSISNIIAFCRYREFRIDFERAYTTGTYYMKTDGDEFEVNADSYGYQMIFFEPILKAALFYLGALGLLELRYDKPKSQYNIKAKDEEYISIWDSLKYIKLTPLGEYIFGFKESYTPQKIVQSSLTMKFDEYKPIITISPNDIITKAKLDIYAIALDNNRYILNYTKIFRDCKSYKLLEAKIESFYRDFGKKLPKVFDDYFDEIKANSNMLKRDLKQVVIELKNNKKLLNLFMSNKNIQNLIIKAEGYRIIVAKDNISKLTKILKDNGFFMEF
ncbi:MAG: hypothetical protein QM493_06865 [Sulfurovum sp.]